jgi:hypothetical protein
MLAQSETGPRIDAAGRSLPVAADGSIGFLQWGAIIAGALLTAAIWLIFIVFGSLIGLAVLSFSPSWRDTSPALTVVSGIYLVLAALTSFSLGGYAAGRFRERWAGDASSSAREFRDGAHGVLAWAIAVVVSSLLVAASAAVVASKTVASATSTTAVAGEPLIAYQLDRLFRAERPLPAATMTYSRAEAARMLLTSTGRKGITVEDRAYLAWMVASETGIAPSEAQHRVDEAIAATNTAVHKARASGVILGFSMAAALLLGAAAAWGAASAGGRHRDETAPPIGWRFGWRW